MPDPITHNWPVTASAFNPPINHVTPADDLFFQGYWDEIEAIETELGLAPSAAYATVTARLAAMDVTAESARKPATVVVSTDGVGADTASIQTALNTIQTAGSGRIIIRNGTYQLTAKLTFNGASVSIEGEGAGTIIKHAVNLADYMLECGTTGTAGNEIKIRNLTLDGNKANQSGTPAALAYFGLKTVNVLLEDLNIINYKADGIRFNDSHHPTVNRCNFTSNNTKSIDMYYSPYFKITNNYIDGGSTDGITADLQSFDSEISGNTLRNGVQITNYAIRTRIERNWQSEAVTRGINNLASGVIIARNYIGGTTTEPIYNTGDEVIIESNYLEYNKTIAISSTGDGVKIENNIIASTTTAAILSSGADTLISGNTIRTGAGLGINATGINAKIENNVISTITGTAIQATGINAIIKSNNITTVSVIGIRATAADAIIDGNIIPATAAKAIEGTAAGQIITNNIITTTTTEAITSSGDGTIIAGNKVKYAGTTGIYCTGNHTLITGNRIINSVGTGINATGGRQTINNNEVCDNGDTGIVTTNGNDSKISGNNVQGNANGIAIDGENRCQISDNNVYANTAIGIYIVDSGCTDNLIVGNHVTGNGSAQITDNGTDTKDISNTVAD